MYRIFHTICVHKNTPKSCPKTRVQNYYFLFCAFFSNFKVLKIVFTTYFIFSTRVECKREICSVIESKGINNQMVKRDQRVKSHLWWSKKNFAPNFCCFLCTCLIAFRGVYARLNDSFSVFLFC